MAALRLTHSQWQAMLSQVTRLAPEEACGLVAGKDRRAEMVLPVENGLHARSRFRMDPAGQVAAFQQIEAAGLELLAIYHSHPAGPAYPSPTDLAEHQYLATPALIFAFDQEQGWRGRLFQIQAGQAVELDLHIAA